MTNEDAVTRAAIAAARAVAPVMYLAETRERSEEGHIDMEMVKKQVVCVATSIQRQIYKCSETQASGNEHPHTTYHTIPNKQTPSIIKK